MIRTLTTFRRVVYIVLVSVIQSVSSFSYGQGSINPARIHLADLPKRISYRGDMKLAFRWQDRSGDNIALISETGEYSGKRANGDNRHAELEAHSYLLKNGSVVQNWKLQDFVKDCPVDIRAEFFQDAFQVTDLNHDGIAEVWIMYKLACSGDVSPAEMKIIMYQDKKKYAVRGRNRVQVSQNEYDGGEYTLDSAFLKGPKEFMDHAKELWNNHLNETWK